MLNEFNSRLDTAEKISIRLKISQQNHQNEGVRGKKWKKKNWTVTQWTVGKHYQFNKQVGIQGMIKNIWGLNG